MNIDLLQKLIYLDRSYMADLFEIISGQSPETTITKNQGKKAGATIPVFSAEVNAQETRSYKVSTLEMLSKAWPKLSEEPYINRQSLEPGTVSQYGWVEGELSVYRARSSTIKGGETTITSETEHFHIRQAPDIIFPLITTEEYFFSSLGNLVALQKSVLKELSTPIRAYLRVIAARDHMENHIAIPLVMVERH